MLDHELRRTRAVERRVPREAFVQHRSDGIDVRRAAGLLPLALLRSHVLGSPVHHPGHGQLLDRHAGEVNETEVEELHVVRADDHHVARFDVAMNDSRVVSDREHLEELIEDRGDERDRYRSPLDDVREGLPAHQLHDHERLARVLTEVEERHDAPMTEARQSDCLPSEARAELGGRCEDRMEELDRDRLVELHVGRAVDRSHAAAADEVRDPVFPADRRVDSRVGTFVSFLVHETSSKSSIGSVLPRIG